jgi:hypothetical protein
LPDLAVPVEPLLVVRRTLREQFVILHRRLLAIVRDDEVCRPPDNDSRRRSGGVADLSRHRRRTRSLPQIQGGRGGVWIDLLQVSIRRDGLERSDSHFDSNRISHFYVCNWPYSAAPVVRLCVGY